MPFVGYHPRGSHSVLPGSHLLQIYEALENCMAMTFPRIDFVEDG